MKQKGLSWPVIGVFLLSLLLIVTGLYLGADTFSHFEHIALTHEDHAALLYSIQATALTMMGLGSLVIIGIGILLILFLHLIRRTARIQREADALRRKNDVMEALNAQTQQLAHHQRLEIIGTMTSSIAHEFNNLLTPIMGYSMMALEKLPPEEEGLYEDLLEIYQASRKAKNIISRLSDLSRKNTSTTFHLICPDNLIQKTLEVANPAKPAKVEIKLNLNCWEQRLWANEIQLSQLLLNLFLNAFHAMEEDGGVLTVETSFDESNICICVSDTGNGIPVEIQPRIFEPFFTTKEAGKGTGLGLAIVAQVVEDHQGSLRVSSTEGEGTAFTVSLPRSRDSELQN